jgi:hypothetical protein
MRRHDYFCKFIPDSFFRNFFQKFWFFSKCNGSFFFNFKTFIISKSHRPQKSKAIFPESFMRIANRF